MKLSEGIIVKQKSNLYTVYDKKKTYECRARGKFRNDKITPLVGDFCMFDKDDLYINSILDRKNELNRPHIANVDYAIIMTSVKEPSLSLNLLDKELVCILNENITPIICLSKMDLLNRDELKSIKKIIKYYKSIGFIVLTNKNIRKLKKILKNKTVVLTGQTGSGKSSLINKLDKSLNLETNEISKALGRGVHTTRHTQIYEIKGIFIADTPGFSALDLNVRKDRLKELYPEFTHSRCKFDDCNHINTSKCSIIDDVNNGKILKSRYDNYVKFWGEL